MNYQVVVKGLLLTVILTFSFTDRLANDLKHFDLRGSKVFRPSQELTFSYTLQRTVTRKSKPSRMILAIPITLISDRYIPSTFPLQS
jgi:hypothetical protein